MKNKKDPGVKKKISKTKKELVESQPFLKTEKRIPTIVGLLLAAGLVISLVLLRQTTVFKFMANSKATPQEVRVTNITDNSFTVSWFTSLSVPGLVEIVDGGTERLFKDFRTSISDNDSFKNHYVIVDGLENSKEYQFSLFSGTKRFYSNNADLYSIKTAAGFFGELPLANLASGVVKTSNHELAEGAIVYLDIKNIAPLSSLVTNQGNWVVSLAKAFSADLTGLANYEEGLLLEEIFVRGVGEETASALVFTKDDDPVPLIVLGGQYDFTEGQTTFDPALDTSDDQASLLGDIETGFTGSKPFQIGNPEDGERLIFRRPEIFGTGPKGNIVKIVIESETVYEAELEIDSQGDWSWSPPQDLEPGSHTLTVTHIDPVSGKEETFVRNFILAAAIEDDEPFFSATPSGDIATATPTLTPTLTLTPVPSITATPTTFEGPTLLPTATTLPVLSPTTTFSPTSTPTGIAEVSPSSQPSTESGVPETGFFGITLTIIIASLILFLTVLARAV